MGAGAEAGGNVRDTLKNHRSLPAAPASLLAASIPEAISDLLASLLSKKPAERPTDRDEILRILDEHQLPWEPFAALGGETVSSGVPGDLPGHHHW